MISPFLHLSYTESELRVKEESPAAKPRVGRSPKLSAEASAGRRRLPGLGRRVWYIFGVKPSNRLLLCVLVLLAASCGKSLEGQLKDAVRQLDNADLKEDAVEILQVTESGDYAIAEVKVRTAFKLRRRDGGWVVEEIRIGDRRWEKADTILGAINARRVQDTRQLLDELAEGIAGYAARRGGVPQTADFESLIDALTPGDLKRVVRLDAWSNPFSYRPLSDSSYDLRSAGADGQLGTEDDLVAGSLQP